MNNLRKPAWPLAVFALFFASGTSGLVFELLWVRMLSPRMGASPATTAIVVGLFMGGLALGSLAAARIRFRPLAAYGAAEVAVGLWGLATPQLLTLASPLFLLAFQLGPDHPFLAGMLHFVAAAALILPPTTMMGLSFPLLARQLAGQAPALYAINTAGAVLGCLAGGLLLLPAVGLDATRVTASVVNLAVGIVAWILSYLLASPAADRQPAQERRTARCQGMPVVPTPGAGNDATRLLAVSFLWGSAAMAFELACERTLALALGSSVYSLTLVVSTFIGGLALGGALFARWRPRRPWLSLAGMALTTGLATAAIIPVLGGMSAWMVPIVTGFAPYSFLALLVAEVLVVAALLLPPTFVMGAGMPLACGIAEGPASVGSLYAANTLGSIAGSLAAGLLTIPLAGLRATMIGSAALFLAASGLAALRLPEGRARRILAGSITFGLLCLLAQPAWETSILTSGPYLYAGIYQRAASQTGKGVSELLQSFDKVLFHREGAFATVTVRQDASGHRALAVNGKVDASSGLDMATQILVGHLPMVFGKPEPRVLLLGLGSGVTLGAMEKHPARQFDCLELCPEIVEASHYFDHVNGKPLEDSRVSLKMTDARAYMQLSDAKYDVLCCEPSNPWVAGMAGLFTREHFQACRDRLVDDGVICQWVQAYSLAPSDFQSVIRTFTSVFPGATLWEAIEGVDYMLLARKDGKQPEVAAIERALANRTVAADIGRAGVKSSFDLARRLVMSPAALRRFAEAAPIQVEDRPRLEFTAPLSLYRDTGSEILAALEPLRDGPEGAIAPRNPEEEARLKAIRSARAKLFDALRLAKEGKPDAAENRLAEAVAEDPGSAAGESLGKLRLERARHAKEAGRPDEASALYERYLASIPNDPDVWNDLGVLRARRGDHGAARAAYAKALEQQPTHKAALRNMGLAAYNQGDCEAAAKAYEQLIVLDPQDALALNNLGIAYMKLERYEKALDRWRRALRVDPGLERARENIRIVEFLGYR